MNIKTIYVIGGGIGLAAVVVLLFIVSGSQDLFVSSPEQREIRVIPPVLSVREVSATSEDNLANARVVFVIENPNHRPVYLEAIQYDLAVNDTHVALGQWGGIAEGFVVGSEGILIVSGGFSPITSQIQDIAKTNLIAEEWDSMVGGTASYTISGTYAYRLTGENLQTIADEQQFELTYP